jgi:hypothetical protein
MQGDDERARLGWNAQREAELARLGHATLVAARVIVEHRGAYGRFASFEKLRREDVFHARQQDPGRAAARKNWSKTIHRQQRARCRVDPKLRDD